MAETPVRPASKNPMTPINEHRQSKPQINLYYASVAKKFRAAKFITIILLIAFLMTSLAFNRSEITLENLQYLMKFISFTNTETSITAVKINYSSSEKTRLALFIGDLCYLSNNGYALYDSRGNTIMTDQLKYNSPILSVSEKFALCYDLGGYTYAIYNTFSRLKSETLDYPINDADISDNGVYAIGTSSREYRTAVLLYDSNFKLKSRILRENYLTDLKLKSDGSEVAVMTTGTDSGEFITTVDLIVPGREEVRKSVSIRGLGYSLFYTDTGFVLISDDGINFFDSDLKPVLSVEHTYPLTMSDCSGKYLTCIYKTGIIGNNHTAVIYDNKGKKVFEGEIDGKISSVTHDPTGEYIFVLADNIVTRINLVNRKIGSIGVESGGFTLLAQSADSFLLAMKNYALTCTPADFSEKYFDLAK
jgi:hypothetical protein